MSSYLVPGTGTDGTQLWIVTVAADGSSSASRLVNFYPGSNFPAFANVTSVGAPIFSPEFTPFKNGFLFVAAGQAYEANTGPNYGNITGAGAATGIELWYTNGTAAGTHLVYDNFKGTHQVYDYATAATATVGYNGSPSQIVALGNDTALFVARTDSSGSYHLFSTQGYAGVETEITANNFTNPTNVTDLNGVGVFIASTPAGGVLANYLFTTDGTNATEFTGETNASVLKDLTTITGRQEVLFSGDDHQLWVTDGTNFTQLTTTGQIYQVTPVVALNPGTALFFSGNDLWVTDSTAGAGTHIVTGGIKSGPTTVIESVGTLTNSGGSVDALFAINAGGNTQYAIWASDGTAAGTVQVGTSAANAPPAGVALGNEVVFTATDSSGNSTLNVTNGTVAGTSQLVAQSVSALKAAPAGQAIFNEIDGSGNATLFITNGTSAGTHAVTGAGLAGFNNYTPVGNDFFFTAVDASTTYGLFAVGETGNATRLNLGTDTNPTGLGLLGGELLFNATNAAGTTDTWTSDGTQAGTHLVQATGVLAAGNATTPFGSTALACFLAGTRLRTPGGDIPVEALREGDLVLTASGAVAPIVWIGQRTVDLAAHPTPERVSPVRIRRGTFADNVPARDLLLSPDHAIAFNGALIPAASLIDGIGVTQEWPRQAHYFHVELPRHDVVLAENLAVESYLDTGNRDCFDDSGAVIQLHPDFWALHWDNACAPLMMTGAVVEAARQRLRDRVEMLLAA